jgi:hypothetical protein
MAVIKKKPASAKKPKKKKEVLAPGKPRKWLVLFTDGSEHEVMAENGAVAIRAATDEWEKENPIEEGKKRPYMRGYAAKLNEPHETLESFKKDKEAKEKAAANSLDKTQSGS